MRAFEEHTCDNAVQVGLLDIDICGPSLPRMLGLEGEEVHQSSSGWSPVYVSDSLGVMSIGFMLTDPNEAVVWRGPRKNGLIKQFLKDVDWGTLDYLARSLATLPLRHSKAADTARCAGCGRSAGHFRRAHLYYAVLARVRRRWSRGCDHATGGCTC